MFDLPQHAASPQPCSLTRRRFLETTTAGIASVSALSPLLSSATTAAAEAAEAEKTPTSETLVAQFYRTLTEKQKRIMAFPFDDPLRQEVNNNWHITKATVGATFSQDQQAMIRDIFKGLHSKEYAEKVVAQVDHDNRTANRQGGFDGCSVALFGQPGSGKFEFVFAGRHVTRRCDGDSVKGAAFGGPIFYGHAAEGFNEKPDHPGNIYWYQARRANELFRALDGKQRKLALRSDARPEQRKKTVQLRGRNAAPHGVPVADFSSDQKNLARKVMADVLAPFRQVDVDECMKLIEAQFDNLHFAYYQNLDVGNDRVWDVWQVEGPTMVWYFRGKPHVHTWVNIRNPA